MIAFGTALVLVLLLSHSPVAIGEHQEDEGGPLVTDSGRIWSDTAESDFFRTLERLSTRQLPDDGMVPEVPDEDDERMFPYFEPDEMESDGEIEEREERRFATPSDIASQHLIDETPFGEDIVDEEELDELSVGSSELSLPEMEKSRTDERESEAATGILPRSTGDPDYDCCDTPPNPNYGSSCHLEYTYRQSGSCSGSETAGASSDFTNGACKTVGSKSYKVDCNLGKVWIYSSTSGCASSDLYKIGCSSSCSVCTSPSSGHTGWPIVVALTSNGGSSSSSDDPDYDCCGTPSNPDLGSTCHMEYEYHGSGSCSGSATSGGSGDFTSGVCKTVGTRSYKVNCTTGKVWIYSSSSGCSSSDLYKIACSSSCSICTSPSSGSTGSPVSVAVTAVSHTGYDSSDNPSYDCCGVPPNPNLGSTCHMEYEYHSGGSCSGSATSGASADFTSGVCKTVGSKSYKVDCDTGEVWIYSSSSGCSSSDLYKIGCSSSCATCYHRTSSTGYPISVTLSAATGGGTADYDCCASGSTPTNLGSSCYVKYKYYSGSSYSCSYGSSTRVSQTMLSGVCTAVGSNSYKVDCNAGTLNIYTGSSCDSTNLYKTTCHSLCSACTSPSGSAGNRVDVTLTPAPGGASSSIDVDCCTSPTNPNLGFECDTTLCVGIDSCDDAECGPAESHVSKKCESDGKVSFKVDCDAGIFRMYKDTSCTQEGLKLCGGCTSCSSLSSFNNLTVAAMYVKFYEKGTGGAAGTWSFVSVLATVVVLLLLA